MEAKAAALGVWKAFFSRDPETIRGVLTDDAEWIAPKRNATSVALGVTDHMVGREAIVGFLTHDMRRLFSNGIAVEPISTTAEGDCVVFEQMQRATLANGRRYENAYVFIFEMDGTRVRRIREYMDTYNGYDMVFGDEAPGPVVPGSEC